MRKKEKMLNFRAFWADIQTNHKDQMVLLTILNSSKLKSVVLKDNYKEQTSLTII